MASKEDEGKKPAATKNNKVKTGATWASKAEAGKKQAATKTKKGKSKKESSPSPLRKSPRSIVAAKKLMESRRLTKATKEQMPDGGTSSNDDV